MKTFDNEERGLRVLYIILAVLAIAIVAYMLLSDPITAHMVGR